MTVDNVESLNKWRMQKNGESMFLGCECGSNEFALVCVASNNQPVISGIVCTGCGKDSNVSYGKVE